MFSYFFFLIEDRVYFKIFFFLFLRFSLPHISVFNWVNKAQIDYIIRAYEAADRKCHHRQALMEATWTGGRSTSAKAARRYAVTFKKCLLKPDDRLIRLIKVAPTPDLVCS